MALDRELQVISLPASGDLSSYQFKIMAVDANGRAALASGTADKVIGVLMNKPTTLGEGAEVAIGGVSRVYAGGSVAPGDTIVSNAQGFALAGSGATSVILGRALSAEATGSGKIFECLIQPSVL